MAQVLPRLIDPLKLAERGVRLEGTLGLRSLRRLAALLLSQEGDVDLALRFGADERGRMRVRGRAKVAVRAECQRCLGPVDLELQAEIDLLLVAVGERPAQADEDEEEEVLEVGAEPVELAGLVEDELLLAAPMVFLHAEGACRAPAGGVSEVQPEEQGAGERENPFAALEALRGRQPPK